MFPIWCRWHDLGGDGSASVIFRRTTLIRGKCRFIIEYSRIRYLVV